MSMKPRYGSMPQSEVSHIALTAGCTRGGIARLLHLRYAPAAGRTKLARLANLTTVVEANAIDPLRP